jgi:recombination associated protein RdgC
MWFKNLRWYRFTEPCRLTVDTLASALETKPFEPCGKLDLERMGFVSPLGPEGALRLHANGQSVLIALKRQAKILPAGVVREALEEKVAAISEKEGRRLGRKERDGLKDELIFELLPKAFTKSALDTAYIDLARGWVLVNTASASRAETLLSALREVLGSLPVVPVKARTPIPDTLTRWLLEAPTTGFSLGADCELRSAKDERVVRCKKQDLTAEEVVAHLHAGLHVSQLAVDWQSMVSGVIDQDGAIRRLRFSDAIQEKALEANAESRAETLDAEFAVMLVELGAFLESFALAMQLEIA